MADRILGSRVRARPELIIVVEKRSLIEVQLREELTARLPTGLRRQEGRRRELVVSGHRRARRQRHRNRDRPLPVAVRQCEDLEQRVRSSNARGASPGGRLPPAPLFLPAVRTTPTAPDGMRLCRIGGFTWSNGWTVPPKALPRWVAARTGSARRLLETGMFSEPRRRHLRSFRHLATASPRPGVNITYKIFSTTRWQHRRPALEGN